MTVKVSVYETTPKEVLFRAGLTLGQALTAAGYTASSDVTVSVNRKKRNMSHVLHDDDRVMVTPNIKNGRS